MHNLETMLHQVIDERDQAWGYYAGTDGVEHLIALLDGQAEGRCTCCGKQAEVVGWDEGPAGNHYLEKHYRCACGNEFTERFYCIPTMLK